MKPEVLGIPGEDAKPKSPAHALSGTGSRRVQATLSDTRHGRSAVKSDGQAILREDAKAEPLNVRMGYEIDTRIKALLELKTNLRGMTYQEILQTIVDTRNQDWIDIYNTVVEKADME